MLVLSVWLLSRPYAGLIHDSRTYIGRALADLHPHGLGRDLLFSLDGQTQLSGYSLLSRPLVGLLGPDLAGFVLTGSTLILWLVAAAALAERLVGRRFATAAIVCAAMLPTTYGPFAIFSLGEAFAAPRGLAEACVLLAVACALEQRTLLAFAGLGLAAFMHVPTAVAGAGVVFLFAVQATPLLWLLVPLGGAAVVASGLMHVGPARTLFQAYDPAWLAAMRLRNPFLFLDEWSGDGWSHAIVSTATILIAALFVEGGARLLLLAAVAVAGLGIAVAYAVGDLTASMLVVQLQLWRTLWLAKLLSLFVIPLCAERLWSGGRADHRLALALLIGAWWTIDGLWLAAPLSLAAVGLVVAGRVRGPLPLSRAWARAGRRWSRSWCSGPWSGAWPSRRW
jgi:hypothetical protein